MHNMEYLRLSALGHTWLFDLDGTVLKHNGWMTEEGDILLAGAKEMLDRIPNGDVIVFLTSRKEEQRRKTESFLRKNHIRYDYIIFDLPYGERIVVNDEKPSGLCTAVAISTKRDCCWRGRILIDDSL